MARKAIVNDMIKEVLRLKFPVEPEPIIVPQYNMNSTPNFFLIHQQMLLL